MANSAKRRKCPAAVGVDEYDDYIILSSGIVIVLLFSWCSFQLVMLQGYQYVMFLFRFDQKRSFDRKKILFALALCILQQQLVILWWKFCSPNRFASDQWLHSKSPRNIYDQMTPLAEPDWHKRRPFAPGDAVFIEWNVDAFNAHILWSGGTGFQGIWALVTSFPKEDSTVPASSFQTGVDFPASAGVVVRGLPLNGDSCYAANQSCLPFLIILAI